MSYFLDYQSQYIDDNSKFILVEKSRRTGFTYATAYKMLLKCMQYPGHKVFYLANTERFADTFISTCKKIALIFNLILQEEYFQLKDLNKSTLSLPNGSSINGMSSNPDGLRGEGGTVVLDEFAIHKNQGELLAAATPMLDFTKNAQLIIISTHKGPTIFAQECKNPKYSKHRITLTEAAHQGLWKVRPGNYKSAEDLIDRTKAEHSLQQYQQEYDCQVMATGSQVISPEEYDACPQVNISTHIPDNVEYEDMVCGIDIGRTHDLTVCWVIGLKGDFLDTVSVLELNNVSIPEQTKILYPIVSHKKMTRVYIDQGTVGRGVSDGLCEELEYVRPANFNRNFKEEIAEELRKNVQHKRISLPKSPRIKEDLISMQTSHTISGQTSYNGSTEFSHADYFWACALANYAAKKISKVFVQ